jgi:predicted SprT family Zn-dependent metalloprotease
MKDIQELFEECKKELYNIGINVEKDCKVDIQISKRNNKRYGCCKPDEPDKATKYNVLIRKKKYVKYYRYKKYHIEISPWVMELDDIIVKNTIIHELIHCLPECDNHGSKFKRYASFINEQLGYNIARLGNKAEDYKKSNKQFDEEIVYNYEIKCKNCGQTFYRKKINKGFEKKYFCGKCKGKFIVISGKFKEK